MLFINFAIAGIYTALLMNSILQLVLHALHPSQNGKGAGYTAISKNIYYSVAKTIDYVYNLFCHDKHCEKHVGSEILPILVD